MDSNPELTLRAQAVYSGTRTFQYRVQRHIHRDLQTHFKNFFSILSFHLSRVRVILKYVISISLNHLKDHLTSERCSLITSICIYNLIDIKNYII